MIIKNDNKKEKLNPNIFNDFSSNLPVLCSHNNLTRTSLKGLPF